MSMARGEKLKKKETICASFSGDMYHDFPAGTTKEAIVKHFKARADRRGVEVHVIQCLDSGEYVEE